MRFAPSLACVLALAAISLPSLAGAQAAPLPRTHAPRPTQPAITAADLMTRLYAFADDSMQGREAGQPGNVKATEFIARELKRLGLQPAGEEGGWFQNVPLVARRPDSASTIRVGDSTFRIGRDFVLQPLGMPAPFDTVQVMFGGAAGDTTTGLTPDETRGKLVLVSFGELTPTPALFAAKAIALIGPPQVPPEFAASGMRASVALPGRSAFGEVPTIMVITSGMAATLLGADPATLKPHAAGRTAIGGIRYVEDELAAPARNVVAILRGRDPALAGEFVAFGAHSDHIGMRAEGPVDHDSVYAFNRLAAKNPSAPPMVNVDSLRRLHRPRPDSVFNGADDDGSGSMALLEVAEWFAKAGPRPKRSLLFIWHTAEEKGLYGSQWFAEHPTVARDSIVANLDVDMIGRGGAADLPNGGPRYLMTVGSRRLSSELGDILDRVNAAEPMPFTIDLQYDAPGHPEQLYCRSDHVNYARFGIPSVAISTGLHPDYHALTDEPQDIEYAHYARVTRLLADFGRAVADAEHRPRLDHPKPDPDAPCKQ